MRVASLFVLVIAWVAARPRTAAVTALTLAAGSVGAAATLVAAASDADMECVKEARTTAGAFSIAAECGHEVEILERRDIYSTSWARPSGNLRTEESAPAVRTDIHGEWEPVDASVEISDGGVPEVAAPVFEIGMSADAEPGARFAQLADDALALGMDLPVGLGRPAVDEDDPRLVVYPILDAASAEIPGCGSVRNFV